MKLLKFILIVLSLSLVSNSYSQCNTNNTICQQGTAGPFNFGNGGTQVSTCLDFLGTSQFTYIVLYITQSGPLNLLIDGNATTGFLDVAIFNVPPGITPCDAILNNANEIGCNYAVASSGCNQFGTAFPCASSLPAPNVVAGQVLMIVVEDWGNGPSTNFTLQLGPQPGAQTGPPNTTITPVGPFCTTATSTQLQAVNMGGVWTGPGVGPTGLFDPSVAGPGTHTITYSLGQAPCNSTSTTQITVTAPPVINPTSVDVTCFGDCDGTADAGVSGATYLWSPGGQTTQTISGLCPGNYTVTVTQNGCTSTGTVTVNQPPQVVIGGPISHN
jgi:hypothetical protein